MPPDGLCGFERVSALDAMPECASVKSCSPIETVSDEEYGAIEIIPAVGSVVSVATSNGAGAESTPALFVATALYVLPPVLDALKVTPSALPVCVVDRKFDRVENV